MAQEGQVFCYSSDNEINQNGNQVENEVENEIVLPPQPVVDIVKRGRGKAISWVLTAEFPTIVDALDHIDRLNKPVVTRVKGRIHRGKTSAFYYACTKVSCGCTKKYRLITSMYTAEVREEESRGDHILHEKFQRNGGRGLSYDQVDIIREASNMGIKKPGSVLEVFQMKADQLRIAGMYISNLSLDSCVFVFLESYQC